jgi:hypothetical protein
MAIAHDVSTAWNPYSGDAAFADSLAFSPAAGSTLVALVVAYEKSTSPGPAVTNTGTSLTWTQRAYDYYDDGDGGRYVYIYTAYNSAAQSNITVRFTDAGTAFGSYPAIAVRCFTGVSSSSPVGTVADANGDTGTTSTLPTGTVNTSAADSYGVYVVWDMDNRAGTPSATGTAATATISDYDAISAYATFTSSGSAMGKSFTRAASGGTRGWQWAAVELLAGATTHTAAATSSITANRTAAATLEASVSASRSSTATLTAAAALERVADATSSVTAAITAAASVERSASASLAVTATSTASASGGTDVDATVSATATLTAAADVTTPGVVTMDVALTVTGATSAGVALDASVAGALAASATLAATATTSSVHEATASRAVTAAITAAASVIVGGYGEPGTMSLADIARATMTPTGSTGSTMRTVLVGFNTATMQAVLDDAASTPLLGVPVFVGDDDPVTLGLIALTTAHVWFHDGTVTVREG